MQALRGIVNNLDEDGVHRTEQIFWVTVAAELKNQGIERSANGAAAAYRNHFPKETSKRKAGKKKPGNKKENEKKDGNKDGDGGKGGMTLRSHG